MTEHFPKQRTETQVTNNTFLFHVALDIETTNPRLRRRPGQCPQRKDVAMTCHSAGIFSMESMGTQVSPRLFPSHSHFPAPKPFDVYE
jgi:hypothetical protein